MKKIFADKSFTTKEIAFLAEEEMIDILPRYTMNKLELIGRDLSKLKPLQKTEVPLWIAIVLKRQNKCSIMIPSWLSVPYLKSKYAEEQKIKNKVSSLPWHWIPISKILLDVCPDDFVDSPHELRSLIQDLRDIRMLKTRQGFDAIDDDYLELTGLSLFEINEIRPLLLQTMDMLNSLRRVTLDEDEDDEESRADQNSAFGNQFEEHISNRHSSSRIMSSQDVGPDSSFHHSNILASDPFLDPNSSTSHINTSTNDYTLVERETVSTTKRRRLDHRSTSRPQAGANPSDDDSDSDVEYRK